VSLSPELSPQQRAAVERLSPEVCVVAGPGSGKTRVLIERFAWLVEQQQIDPARILAITFTEKAAAEIKQRLVNRFASRLDLREKLERAWVTTIDAFCTRLLLENAIAAGLSPDFTILEPALADRLKREAAEQALDSLFAEQPAEMRRLLEGLDLSTSDDTPQQDLAAALIEIYEAQRISGVREMPLPTPEPGATDRVRELCRIILADRMLAGGHAGLLREWARDFLALPTGAPEAAHFRVLGSFAVSRGQLSKKGPGAVAAKELKDELLPKLHAQWLEDWYEGVPELIRSVLSRLDSLYRNRKRKDATLDFHDLEEQAIQLLESDERVYSETRGRFDHVLMDELQDTNPLQWRLVNLVRRNFFAVGDINQSIYGFRHADPQVFTRYRDSVDSKGAVDQLNENYRSRSEILSAVEIAFEGQPGIEPHPLVARRDDLKWRPVAVERLVGMGEQAADIEAALVAQKIREWTDAGEHKFGDIAVLVRALSSTGPFEQAFDRFDIPFVVGGGRTFLEARETRDILLLLRALVNPLDDIATVGVLRSPLFGMADEEIYRLGREGWLVEFDRLFGTIRQMAGFVPPDQLLARTLDECGYVAGLPPRARANVDKLLGWIRREFSANPQPLAELLEDLESLRAGRSEAEAPPPEAADVVRILSVHAAKGLEFPVVFVSALHRTPDQRSSAMSFSATLGLGWKWRNPVTGEVVPSRVHKLIQEEQKVLDKAEENRLLYVAMTRAEDRLVLSYAEKSRKSAWQKLAEASVAEVTSSTEFPDLPPRAAPAGDAPATDMILPMAAPTGQYDSTASVTSVALFDACPRKYYLSRYLGFEPEPDDQGTGAIQLGLEVHKALAGQEADSPEAHLLKARFESSPLGQRVARAQRVEREFDVLFAIEDVVLRGQIDLWFEEGGELILVDYKSGRDESRSAEYALQLRLYALALSRYAGRLPDRAVLFYLWSENAVEVSLGEGDLRTAKRKVWELKEAQERLDLALKPGEQCQRCPFHKGLCPAP
jgi:ATP-dependent helicase/nuclease subunit A